MTDGRDKTPVAPFFVNCEKFTAEDGSWATTRNDLCPRRFPFLFMAVRKLGDAAVPRKRRAPNDSSRPRHFSFF